MKKQVLTLAVAAVAVFAIILSVSPAFGQGRPDAGVVYVIGQGLLFETFGTTDLPPYGPFQELIQPDDPANVSGFPETEYGPGDPGYVGGRWWVDVNGNGEQDEEDKYFQCPLLGPGVPLNTTAIATQKAFIHGITLNVDGQDYYLAGAPDGPDGATDIPGHYWVVAGNGRLIGKHYNFGPFGAPQWWSSDAVDGELLYIVYGIIDTWSEQKSAEYASAGFIHYHELVSVSDGTLHPDKVVWLKHIARTTFMLDGGPHPELSHPVSPGVDYEFVPNFDVPYP